MLGLCVLLWSSLHFVQPAYTTDLGVGFSLSLDYGVSSIHFANGSSIGIAKVEGGPEYKQMMRAQRWAFYSSPPFFDEAVGDERKSMQTPLSTGKRPLRDRLPPWLGGPKPDPRVDIVSRMLGALKTATESYVGSKIRDAEVGFPFYISQIFLDVVNTASSKQSLDMPQLRFAPAGEFAASAHGVFRECPPSCSEQLILTIDYSRAALTAILMNNDYGVPEIEKGIHKPMYGTDSWSNEYWDQLVSDLRELIRIPDRGYPRPKHISTIFLLGESAGEKRLGQILEEVLWNGNERNGSMSTEIVTRLGEPSKVDPLFASSMGLADHCLWRAESYRCNGPLCNIGG